MCAHHLGLHLGIEKVIAFTLVKSAYLPVSIEGVLSNLGITRQSASRWREPQESKKNCSQQEWFGYSFALLLSSRNVLSFLAASKRL